MGKSQRSYCPTPSLLHKVNQDDLENYPCGVFASPIEKETFTMNEEILLMSRIRDLPTLDQKFQMFADYLKAEHHYDGVTYGVCLNSQSIQTSLETTIMKVAGMSPEWMGIYIREQLALNDPMVVHAVFYQDLLLNSTVYKASDHDEFAPRFSTLADKMRDFIKSGFVLPMKAGQITGGLGLHSSTLEPEIHDARFAQNHILLTELCHQFHDICHWADEVVAHTGLSAMNLEVLNLKAKGLRVKQILERIDRANPKTVDLHMQRVRKLLHASSDTEAIIKANTFGLIMPDAAPPVV